jgi:hypothetical protein
LKTRKRCNTGKLVDLNFYGSSMWIRDYLHDGSMITDLFPDEIDYRVWEERGLHGWYANCNQSKDGCTSVSMCLFLITSQKCLDVVEN